MVILDSFSYGILKALLTDNEGDETEAIPCGLLGHRDIQSPSCARGVG